MRLHLAIHVTETTSDCTVFGAIAIFHGARLADAIAHLRWLFREGLRSKSDVDAEVALLIDNSRKAP